MRSIVREFRRFQEVRLKFYGLTLDNVRSEIFVKFIIYLGILILAVKTATITKEMSKYLSIHRKIHVVTSSASVGNWCGQIYFGQMTPTVDLSLTWSYTPARRTDRNYIRRGGNLFLSLRKHFKWHWGTSLLKMQLKNAAARITSQCKILLV